MVKEVVWAPSAEKDLNGILSYVPVDDIPRMERFIARMREAVQKLSDFPDIGTIVGRGRDKDLRSFSHWPYRVIYTCDAKRVLILRVLHGARNIKL